MFARLDGVMDISHVGAEGYCLGGYAVMEMASGNPNMIEEAGGRLRAVQPFHASGYPDMNVVNPSIRFQIHHAAVDDFSPFGSFTLSVPTSLTILHFGSSLALFHDSDTISPRAGPSTQRSMLCAVKT